MGNQVLALARARDTHAAGNIDAAPRSNSPLCILQCLCENQRVVAAQSRIGLI